LEVLKAVGRAGQAGGYLYDLGASIGYISLLMARKAQARIPFEPAPHAIAILTSRREGNNLHNLTLVPTSDQRSVRESAFRSAMRRTGRHQRARARFRAEVEDHHSGHIRGENAAPDFIKIDVEGEEAAVLEGARDCWPAAPTIVCELHSVEAAAHSLQVLHECGYRRLRLDGSELSPETVIRLRCYSTVRSALAAITVPEPLACCLAGPR